MNKLPVLKRNDLVYPELSYQIIGILFEVFKQLGPGYKEKFYQKIVALEFDGCGLKYKKEIPVIIGKA